MNRSRLMFGFLDEFEKRGVDPLSIALGAAGGHLALNEATRRAYQNPRFMPDVLRQGYHHGLARQKITPVREALLMKALGPEIPHEYHQARKAGRLARVLKKAKTDKQKARLLNKIQKEVGAVSAGDLNIKDPPEDIIRKLRVAIKKEKSLPTPVEHARRAELRERVHQRSIKKGRKGVLPVSTGAKALLGKKTVHEKHTPSVASKVLQQVPEAAAVAGTFAGNPLAAKSFGHMAMNRARSYVAGTATGKELVKKEFTKGVKGKLSPAVQRVKSLLISPGYADVGNLGAAIGRLRSPGQSGRPSLGRRVRTAVGGLRSRLSRALASRRLRKLPLLRRS